MRHVCDYCYCNQRVWDVTTGAFFRFNGRSPMMHFSDLNC